MGFWFVNVCLKPPRPPPPPTPLGLQILKEFFFSVEGNKLTHCEELVELIHEIDDYKEMISHNDHRAKRLSVLFTRFKPLVEELKSLDEAFAEYNDNKDKWIVKSFPSELLDRSRTEAIAYLDAELIPKFR